MTDRPEDRLEISAEDLEEVEPPPPPPVEPRLEITSDDLRDIPDEPARPYPGMSPGMYPGTPYLPLYSKEKAGGRTSFSNVGQLCLAGAIGGLLGWAITEPFMNDELIRRTPLEYMISSGFFLAFISLCIGACLGAVEGVFGRVWQKALTGAALGAGIGFAGGFFGGVVAQLLFGSMTRQLQPDDMSKLMIARALGWGLAGCFVGVGQGIIIRSGRKVLYGILGGLAGGFAGGMLFDPIAAALHQGGQAGPDSGLMSRMIAITVVGLCAGLGIGLVEEMRKQGWVLVLSGLLSGKQFILYKDQTTLGSSPKCDIVLPKDAAIQPQHAVIRTERERYVLQNLTNTPTVLLNGHPVTGRVLRDGDTIQIGGTTLAFRTVAVEKEL